MTALSPLKSGRTLLSVKSWFSRLDSYKIVLLMVVPALAWYIIFCYIPMGGNIIAFKDFSIRKGIYGSAWVGFKYFEKLFTTQGFWNVFSNQVVISLWKLAIGFPYPIILALALNEVRTRGLKKFYQTVFTFPHFISWIVVSGIIFSLLSDQGVLNQFLIVIGSPKNHVLMDGGQFRWLLYVSEIWKEGGWGSILYLAALAGINPEMYEAARIDGANRWHQLLYITWPGIRPTAAVMLILSAGNILSGGFDQIINLYNPVVMSSSDIIDTFVYRISILSGTDFPFATAAGLFKSVINLIMLLLANASLRLIGEEGIL